MSLISVYAVRARELAEESKVEPKTKNAKKLAKVEEFLLDYNAWILRCGGLIGNRKHPVYYLQHKLGIPRPDAAVNLVHEHDVCRFIKRLIETDKDFGLYNLVCPEHPSRKEYYNEVAKRLGLNALSFDETDLRKGKIVVPKKALEANFSFEYSSPFEMPLVKR
jgi:nucleoside-diphosphate-sugar epimerase